MPPYFVISILVRTIFEKYLAEFFAKKKVLDLDEVFPHFLNYFKKSFEKALK